jgi:hypothetical protein
MRPIGTPTVVAALTVAAAASLAAAADLVIPPFPAGATAEIAAARSAAPEALRAGATVWVTAPEGYSKAVTGSNGVACLVGREDGGGWAPICWDQEGAETILPVAIEKERLRRAGKSSEDVRAAIDAGFRSGRFRAPRRAGVSWMLSNHNYVDAGGRVINYHPHVMIYAPYLTNAEIHGDPRNPALPWVLFEGTPHAYLIVDGRAASGASGTGH